MFFEFLLVIWGNWRTNKVRHQSTNHCLMVDEKSYTPRTGLHRVEVGFGREKKTSVRTSELAWGYLWLITILQNKLWTSPRMYQYSSKKSKLLDRIILQKWPNSIVTTIFWRLVSEPPLFWVWVYHHPKGVSAFLKWWLTSSGKVKRGQDLILKKHEDLIQDPEKGTLPPWIMEVKHGLFQ